MGRKSQERMTGMTYEERIKRGKHRKIEQAKEMAKKVAKIQKRSVELLLQAMRGK